MKKIGSTILYAFLLCFFWSPAICRSEEKPIDPPEPKKMQWDENDAKNFLPAGVVTRESILRFTVYNYNYIEYVPTSDPVEAIHNFPGPLEIRVFFGDWSKESKRHVPAFIKIMEFSDNRNILITYINVNPDRTMPPEEIEKWKIQRIPAFLFVKDTKEVGRIEEPGRRLEEEITALLESL